MTSPVDPETQILDSAFGWGLVGSLCVGVACLTTVLLCTDLYWRVDQLPRLYAALLIGLPLYGPVGLFVLLYRLVLERIVFLSRRERNLQAIFERVEERLAGAERARSAPNYVALARLCAPALRYAKTHPTTGRIQALLEQAHRPSWPAATAGPVASGVYPPKAMAADARVAFFGERSRVAQAARGAWLLSLLLCVGTSLRPEPSLLAGGLGLLGQWLSLVVILRRSSGIIALFGSFLLTVLVVCVVILTRQALVGAG
jgi:hypothetical protein